MPSILPPRQARRHEAGEAGEAMKIVVAHNRYASGAPSGENIIVDAEIEQLRDAGLTVYPFIRESDDIPRLPALQKALLPASPIYNRWTARDLTALLKRHEPDILHLHNPYPLISPWVVRVAQRHGVPVVQTVHNYRQVCSPGTYFRAGGLCTECKGRRFGWPAVKYACYRGSRPQSAIMATTLAVHRGTWRGVDRYIALTEAIAAHLRDFGVPDGRIAVKPNALADPGPPAPIDPAGGFLYAARLVPEKGVPHLIGAWKPEYGRLRIAGDGPMRADVEAFAAGRADVEYLGPLERPRMLATIGTAAAVIVASTWPDVLPTIAIEALAAGRPVLGTSLGGIPWLVGDAGWIVEPGADGLAGGLATAAAALRDRAGAAALSASARSRYETEFTPGTLTRRLVGIYRELHESSRAAAGGTGGGAAGAGAGDRLRGG
jgi:glycosyltransferase involved in cell wall biosynthesis